MPYRHHSNMSLTEIVISAAVLIAILLIASYYSRKAIVKRALKKAQYRRIHHFKEGETAKIVGTVECIDEPLIAPLSGRKCAHYYIHIQQYVSSGKSGHWKTLIEEEVSGTFVLRDGSSCAFIEDANKKSYIVQDREYRSGLWNDATDHLEVFLNGRGHKSENFLGLNKKMRYIEGVLEPGEKTAVLGSGHWKNAQLAGLPGHYGNILIISAGDDHTIYISDDPDMVITEV